MVMSPLWKIIVSYATIAFFFSCLALVTSQLPHVYDYPTANLSSLWINAFNSNILENRSHYDDISFFRPILLRVMPREEDWSPRHGLAYGCGFYCFGPCDIYLFSVFIIAFSNNEQHGTSFQGSPQVVWSANRNNPVGENATVELTHDGDLVLRDRKGALVWSTGTSGKAVAGMNLTETGNLVLFDANTSVIWESFDYPTDCLLVGQRLKYDKNLTAASSSTDWSAGSYSVSMTDRGLVASILSHPPQVYSKITFFDIDIIGNHSYAELKNGSLDLYANMESRYPEKIIRTNSTAAKYMKLENDGHLRVFVWSQFEWKVVADILTGDMGECGYPMACGKYGICSNPRQCSCHRSSFKERVERRPDLGCSEIIPLTCNSSENHRLLDLDNVTYLTFGNDFEFVADITNTNVNHCKDACLKNCSCKAAMFRYTSNASVGDCYLPKEIFSLMSEEEDHNFYHSSVSVKVQIAAKERTSFLGPILGTTIGVFLVFVSIGIAVFVYRRRSRNTEDVEVPEEDYLDSVPGMPTRFSLADLASATHNFSKKLGEGGFGSVYEGSLDDGTRIAVKRLDEVGRIKKSFLAEVESIGSIHHINLVRLIGFCAEKFHRLLVYEYMCNGSLEKWIYSRSTENETSLDWNKRRKIIFDVAKGLAYLHEDCRQKIIHLDIKPQNILLDEHYNAKLADFGLSKLIDRDQSQVVTTMRGTPGYLAPEWLSAVITEKVDVYSFGVVALEILTGRKIFEQSRPEEERHLLTLFKKKAEEGQWLDLVDKCCQDEECEVSEVEKMMQISAWCLLGDHEKRPSMSMVIKVMEGSIHIPKEIDYNLLIPRYMSSQPSETSSSRDVTPLLPSLLSRPR